MYCYFSKDAYALQKSPSFYKLLIYKCDTSSLVCGTGYLDVDFPEAGINIILLAVAIQLTRTNILFCV